MYNAFEKQKNKMKITFSKFLFDNNITDFHFVSQFQLDILCIFRKHFIFLEVKIQTFNCKQNTHTQHTLVLLRYLVESTLSAYHPLKSSK